MNGRSSGLLPHSRPSQKEGGLSNVLEWIRISKDYTRANSNSGSLSREKQMIGVI
jgi:hypothetical protein